MSRRRVLVVDDEDAIREIAQVSMEVVGDFDVVTASSGAEGLTRAAADTPDAILLDVMMPELDGPGTVARLQADPATRHISVILLTAKVQSSDRTCFAALPGVAGVIAKPFDPMQLPWQVADLLGWDRPAGVSPSP
jgi:CheY-like chemotaxis protein